MRVCVEELVLVGRRCRRRRGQWLRVDSRWWSKGKVVWDGRAGAVRVEAVVNAGYAFYFGRLR